MSKAQDKKKNQVKLARLEIVSNLYKRGYSYRKIREEVMKRLNLSTYSLQTVKNDAQTGQTSIRTTQTERTETDIQGLGAPSYIAEIRKQLEERRKLLGLYAPEKKELSGGLFFASLLVESGMIDEASRVNSQLLA